MDKTVLGKMGRVYVTYVAGVDKRQSHEEHWYGPLRVLIVC